MRLVIASRGVVVLLAALGLQACYSYAPVRDAEPQLGQAFAFELLDPCPASVGDRVGPDTRQVEGTLVQRSDTAFVISVARATGSNGRQYRWNGETVSLPGAYVRQVRARHFSPFRTVVAAGGAALSFVAFVVTRTLVVGGGTTDKVGEPKQTEGNVQE